MTNQKPLLTRAEIVALARQIADLDTADPLHNDMITLRVWELERFVDKVAERAAAAEREAIILLADEMDVERTEYCMSVYEEGEQYKHNLLEAIRARGAK